MEQKQPLQQMELGDLDSYMQKNKTKQNKKPKEKKLDHQLTPYTQKNSRWIKRLKYKS